VMHLCYARTWAMATWTLSHFECECSCIISPIVHNFCHNNRQFSSVGDATASLHPHAVHLWLEEKVNGKSVIREKQCFFVLVEIKVVLRRIEMHRTKSQAIFVYIQVCNFLQFVDEFNVSVAEHSFDICINKFRLCDGQVIFPIANLT